MEPMMERLARALLARRWQVLAAWALLCVVGAVFAAGLPGRIVSGGEAPASADSEVVAQALAHSPLPSLFLAVQVPEDLSPEGQQAVSAEVAAKARQVRGVTAAIPMADSPPVEV